MVPAYVIAESEHADNDEVRHYRELAAKSVVQHGGRYLVRGGEPEAREGHWAAGRRLVIIEFPTIEQAHGWYNSQEYQAALATRSHVPERRMLFVDGVITTPVT
jgi:uncharacterized protein (DUF1330 family)